MPQDDRPYPVITTYADEVLTWSPSATDTLIVGVGRLEIRVTYGDVVGKSVQIVTIVEESLADGIAEPPEPPAQEWLNQVLSALAELDIDEINNLLNLTYNLLNTTHDLVEDTRDNLYMRTGILLNHSHPIETATAPDMISRRASITFSGITNGNNVVIGTVVYTFVTSLGNPTPNNAQVLIQDTLRNTVKTLSKAIRGIEDEINIAYGTGTDPNPTCTAYWTSQRFSIGDVTVAPGESLFVLEREENGATTILFTSTATATINSFTRITNLRYILSGNVSGSGGVNSIRGPLHTVLPINSVVIGGQGGLLYPATYDCHLLTLCRQSDTSEKELDLYISNDEETFTRIQRSTPVGSDSSTEALHVHIQMRQATSYDAQIDHYTAYIKGHPDWVLAGIYADDGITGTSTKKREEFNRMIDDCMTDNIDMIITKSISRFARNTLDCLKYIRQLKDKSIQVFFEKKDFDTAESPVLRDFSAP